ncbi:MAG: GGDEF domain-containing protein [Ruminococcus sp.]|nr:GGDEF domain-containing protein [Ruminococcus sp.]
MDFHVLFENYLKTLNSLQTMDIEKIRPALTPVCELLRIGKILTVTYGNTKFEAMNRGENLISYDSGRPAHEVITKRIVTDLMAIIKCSIYIEDDQEPWTPEEMDRIRMLIETTTVYVSRAKIQAAAERFAFLDDDGYHNLRFFIRHIERTAQNGSFAGQTALHFNLKHFALVNQQIGRRAGSVVMQGFFRHIEELLGDKGIVARMGGDNFVALCSTELLDELLSYLRGAAVVYNVNNGDRIMVSASVGVFVIPEDFKYTDAGDILDKIITTSTAARTSGQSDIIFFSEAMNANKEKVNRLQRLFPEALNKEEFRVFYQPKIDITTGELIGAEALCRWFHEDKLIPPMDFIPILEQGLDICKLDFYMLDHVCRDIRRWLDEGRRVVRVSVNLSRKHMMDIDLLEHIMEIVNRNNVPHEFIEVELTETTTDVEFRDLKRVVSGLQQQGISTSVDDFGMGYSSLNLIKEVPWNVLKIDRSFLPVEEDDDSSTRSVMFKYVVAMAKELGLECIAEGVETMEQVNVLRDNNCELAQGFFFDRPLPTEEFEKRLTTHHYELAAQ